MSISIGAQPTVGPRIARDARAATQPNPIPGREFTHFVVNNTIFGHIITGQQRSYIPFTKLRGYWTIRRIGQLLGSSRNDTFDHQIIQEHYLRVLSALVYIDKVDWLYDFTQGSLDDRTFPSVSLPNCWTSLAPRFTHMWDVFSQHQWLFFPLTFDSNHLLGTRIHPQCILPVNPFRLVAESDAAKVYMIEIHEGYNKLKPEAPSSGGHNTFILKSYIGARQQDLYDNERRALMAIRNNPSDHVVTYYGSFEQGDRRNLILEYVNGGTLLDLLKNTPPPSTRKDIHEFWTSLTFVMRGIHRIHQITNHSEHATDYRSVHEDLKPDNILLAREPGGSPYQFLVKIADFGYSHLRSVNRGEEDGLGLDQHGNPTYSAPEATHHQRYLQKGPNRMSGAADIWAMGCILSEVATWLVLGAPGLATYLEKRRTQIRAFKTFDGSGYSDCFHDGSKALSVVNEMHKDIISRKRSVDSITTEILGIVEQSMLARNPDERSKASVLMEDFQRVIDGNSIIALPTTPNNQSGHAALTNASWELSESSPSQDPVQRKPQIFSSTPEHCSSAPPLVSNPFGTPKSPDGTRTTPPAVHRPQLQTSGSSDSRTKGLKRFRSSISRRSLLLTPSTSFATTAPTSPISLRSPTTPLESYLSIEDVLEYRRAKKLGETVGIRTEGLVEKLKTNLGSRDHMFFIENSPSMQRHAEQALHAFSALSYLAKQIDKDEIEMAFASHPSTVHSHPHTRQLIEILKHHDYAAVQGLMEKSLGEFIIKNIIGRLQRPLLDNLTFLDTRKPISIFIFTDGCWGSGLPEAAGVEHPIRNLMEKIKKLRLHRTQVMIQFIRFGQEFDGMRYLEYLDDFGREDCDIVDTESVDGNVFSMFIGSLSQAIDKRTGSIPELG